MKGRKNPIKNFSKQYRHFICLKNNIRKRVKNVIVPSDTWSDFLSALDLKYGEADPVW